jgi:hypothetical protein
MPQFLEVISGKNSEVSAELEQLQAIISCWQYEAKMIYIYISVRGGLLLSQRPIYALLFFKECQSLGHNWQKITS